MKACKECKAEKEPSEFYKDKCTKDGLYGRCKECLKNDPLRKKAKEKYRKSEKGKIKKKSDAKKYNESEKGRLAQKRNRDKFDKLNPVRKTIRRQTQYLVDSGKILKMPCNVCGELRSEAHHIDYSDARNIVWLCSKHHKEWHRRNLVFNRSGIIAILEKLKKIHSDKSMSSSSRADLSAIAELVKEI